MKKHRVRTWKVDDNCRSTVVANAGEEMMRKIQLSSISPLLLFLLLAACAVKPPIPKPMPPPDLLRGMTLEEKVAQMFMVRYSGNFYSEDSYTYQEVKRLVQEVGIGGVIPFFGTIHGTIENLNELQNLSRIPLLMAADYERGVGQQLDGATLFPTNMALAAAGSPELAYEQGRITAKEARAIGVHVTFAPVMDVNSNPDNPIINFRSFGDSPGIVTRFGSAFIKGTQDNGLIATAKHFPGHGNTGTDSHTSLPVITVDKAEFEKVDLAPFKAAIEAGVKMIMVGHIAVPSLDVSGLPATLSPLLTGELLRDRFGFEGIIVTDAMEMGGITEAFWAGEAAIRAIAAGSDMILLPMDVDKAVTSVVQAVATGRIKESRIDASVRRILASKEELGLWKKRMVSIRDARSVVGKNESRAIASEVARKSITLAKDEKGLIPIPVEQIDTLTHILLATEEGMLTFSKTFRSAVSRIHGNVKTRFFYQPLSDLRIKEVVQEAETSDFILCTLLIRVRMNLGTVSIDDSHRRLISALQATGKPVVVLSFGSPYVADMNDINTYLCAYGYGTVSQVAMADAIFGASAISGKLPVNLSPSLRRGEGLTRGTRKMLERSDQDIDFSEAVTVLDSAIRERIFPGAQVMVTRNGEILWSYQAGRQTYGSDSAPITEQTIYDLASLTKVVATTPLVMKLKEQKKLPLDEAVSHFFPQFAGGDKEKVTIRHLLTHSSGLPPYIRFFEIGVPPEEVVPTILGLDLEFAPGDSTAYSDLGMILLAAIIEKVSGRGLDELAQEWIYSPLGMTRTFYNPSQQYLPDIAPTEVDSIYRKGLVRGIVHDENAWWLGGVAGHAGLFSTATDLARYAQLMMDGGFFEGRRYFKRSTLAQFTRRQEIPPGSQRALGWDTPSDSGSSAGDYFTPGSFGHLGFTGTSMWIDPNQRIAIILLTNRVHPTRERGGIYEVRRRFHNAVMKAIIRHDSGT